MSREILSSCWQYSSKLLVNPNSTSFCFGQFVPTFLFVCYVPVFVSYYYRTASLATSEPFPAVNFFWPVNAFRAKGSPGYEQLFWGSVMEESWEPLIQNLDLFLEHCLRNSSVTFKFTTEWVM
jgi:hypothetical protein